MKMVALVIVAVALTVLIGGFFLLEFFPDEKPEQSEDPKSITIDGREDSNIENASLASSGEKADEVLPRVPITDPGPLLAPVNEVFAYTLPLLDGFEEMESEGLWSYDEKIKNTALWDGLCRAGDDKLSAMSEVDGGVGRMRSQIDTLCQDFDAVMIEVDDFFEAELIARGRSPLEKSLDDHGPDAATILAISELSRALELLNYAGVLDVVWFLGIFNLGDVSEEFTVYHRQPKVETIFAVAASIFCTHIGGCNASHPVTVHLCFVFDDLPCSRHPRDIYDSIDQILTGHELENFNEMNNSLIRLLNQYRRGEL